MKTITKTHTKLLENIDVLTQQNIKKEGIIDDLNQQITTLEYRLQLALRHRFSKRSEKPVDMNQLDLFNEIELPDNEEPVTEEVETTTVKRKKTGRKPLPKDLPREYREYDLPDEQKTCHCGTQKTLIGKETSEQLEVIPAIMYVVEHAKLKYACKACEGGLVQAKAPLQPIPKSNAGPGLLAHILVGKFCDHLPFYRQESILKRSGVDLGRATLCQWAKKSSELVIPLINLMQEGITEYDVAYADETTCQVLKEKGRTAGQKSYMWLFGGGAPDKFCWIYQYHPGRQGHYVETFFQDYQGYLHVDGYAGYKGLGRMGTRLVGCMAHARRRFFEVSQSTTKKKGLAHTALGFIGKLYHIEKTMRENALTSDDVKIQRQEQAKPILDAFKIWCIDKSNKTPPKSPIGKAIAYTLNQWDSLLRYLEDGRLDIDNNRTERSIKPFVIGKKNWMFNDSVEGAQAGARIYSLIETCRAHQIEPYAYLRFMLKRIPLAKTLEDFQALLPYNCDKNMMTEEIEQDRKNIAHTISNCQ